MHGLYLHYVLFQIIIPVWCDTVPILKSFMVQKSFQCSDLIVASQPRRTLNQQ